MSLEVMDVAGLVTIQDSGRKGWRQFGVPMSGPMDRFAFQAANMLVGNSSPCATLEIGLGDVNLRASQDCVVAVAGAGYKLSSYVWDFPLWSSFFVHAGWEIRLTNTDHGMWVYLAVPGGVQTQPILGSRSTYLRGGFGGSAGRSLQPGDRIKAVNSSHLYFELAARTLRVEARPAYSPHPIIDVILGPQTNYFTEESIGTFLSGEYSVTLNSDRMGYRLEGPALIHRGERELISEGMTAGAIQVPANGQPIVMMADGPTTGGYPKIGAVATADLPLLAQCVPGKSKIRFRGTTVEEAQMKYRALMNGLNRVVEAE